MMQGKRHEIGFVCTEVCSIGFCLHEGSSGRFSQGYILMAYVYIMVHFIFLRLSLSGMFCGIGCYLLAGCSL